MSLAQKGAFDTLYGTKLSRDTPQPTQLHSFSRNLCPFTSSRVPIKIQSVSFSCLSESLSTFFMRRLWRTLWNTSVRSRPSTTIGGVSVRYSFINESSLFRTMRPLAWRRKSSMIWWTFTKYQNVNNTGQKLCLFPCRTRRRDDV